MKNLKPVTLGTKLRTSARNYFLWQYLNDYQIRVVSVPIMVQRSLFVFDFQHLLQNRYNIKTTDENLSRLIQLIAATYKKVDDDILIDKMTEMGMFASIVDSDTPGGKGPKGKKDNGVTPQSILNDIKQAIVNQITKSGISTLLYRDVFSAPEMVTLAADDFDLSDVRGAIREIQKLYGQFSTSAPSLEIATFIRDNAMTSRLIQFTQSLLTTIHGSDATYIPAKLSHVIDQMFMSSFKVPYVRMESEFPGKVYRIHDIEVPELSYADTLTATVMGIRLLMGLESTEDKVKLDLKDFVEQQVTGVGQAVPAVPAEIGEVNTANISNFMVREIIKKIVIRVLTSDYGSYETRVKNIIETKKYTRDDSTDLIIRQGIQCCSIVFESFLDTIATFKFFATSEDVYFADINPTKRKQISKFTFDFLEQFKNFNLPMTHVNFYSEPAHIMNHTLAMDQASPDYVMLDADYNKATTFILGDRDESFLKLFSTGILSGSLWDLPDLTRSHRLLNRASLFNPLYKFVMPVKNAILQSDLVKYSFNLLPLSKVTELEFGRDLLQRGQLRYFASVQEMSFAMRLPLEIAEAIFTRGKIDYYLDLTEDKTVSFYFDSDVFPIIEERVLSENAYVPPFLIKWPGFLEDVETSFVMPTTVQTLEKPVGPDAPGGKKGTKKPDSEADDAADTEDMPPNPPE